MISDLVATGSHWQDRTSPYPHVGKYEDGR